MLLSLVRFCLLVGVVAPSAFRAEAAANLVWPTPNDAFQRGEGISAFVQPTSSGRVESGLYGCVRNDGSKFHEGLDLFPVRRSPSGEALDGVFAILPGEVVHVSATAGHSSYGRYVVVQHEQEDLKFHSLYAHLASVEPGLKPGSTVRSGEQLGIMGRSAAGYSIPKSRAHLHLEIGFHLTDEFQAWFDRQDFKSPNRHGMWNGMNLVGIDPLDFYSEVRAGRVATLREYLNRQPTAARIRINTSKIPSFIRNYSVLSTRAFSGKAVVAWDVAFTPFGLPKEWVPRFADEEIKGRRGDVRVLAYDPRFVDGQSCRRVLERGTKVPRISGLTLNTLRKLFGFR